MHRENARQLSAWCYRWLSAAPAARFQGAGLATRRTQCLDFERSNTHKTKSSKKKIAITVATSTTMALTPQPVPNKERKGGQPYPYSAAHHSSLETTVRVQGSNREISADVHRTCGMSGYEALKREARVLGYAAITPVMHRSTVASVWRRCAVEDSARSSSYSCPVPFFRRRSRIRTFAFRMKTAGPSSRQAMSEIAPT